MENLDVRQVKSISEIKEKIDEVFEKNNIEGVARIRIMLVVGKLIKGEKVKYETEEFEVVVEILKLCLCIKNFF